MTTLTRLISRVLIAASLIGLLAPVVRADEYADTVKVFQQAGQSSHFFRKAYAYAVFPNIGKGGLMLVGAAHGKGRVYERGAYIGDSSMTQASFGPQLGGQVYSMIVFFEDKRALTEFTTTGFEFGAQASAVAITAGASAAGGTTGASAGASGGRHDASTISTDYYKGMAVFTVAKGGAMLEAALAGQKFSYKPAGRR